MSESAAEDFVKSLKDKISRKKEKIQTKRNLLQESLDLILKFFSDRTETEIRSIRNFEINEIATYFDVYVSGEVQDTVSKIFSENAIEFQKISLNNYKCVFIIDLEAKLLSSGNLHNLISLEVCSKKLNTYKFRVSVCENGFCYSVFERGYNEIKFWVFHNDALSVYNLNIRGIDRSKKKSKIKGVFDEIDAIVHFSESGSFESLDLSQQRRKKNIESSYNN